jgi:hypothetical protein
MNIAIDDRLTRLVHAEFREMPGLRLTRQQVRRLWGLDPATCDELLAALVASGFLTVMPDGRYARVGDGEAATRRPSAKAAVHGVHVHHVG